MKVAVVRQLCFVCTMILLQPLVGTMDYLYFPRFVSCTIDHDNLFSNLDTERRLIRSYFSGRTQRVQIEGIMSDFASLLCGVEQGSVLG